ncbi:MAG: DNA-3-methyladenine glycosylase I [Mangrovibacterium sp.]
MHTNKCPWCLSHPLYIAYHDEEWGRPIYDDNTLFEFLILEGAQAGLSWFTILKRRENYRRAYDDFKPQIVAQYGEEKVQQLLQDEGIIRNRLKVRGSIINAQCFLAVQEEFGSFSNYLWAFVEGKPIVNQFKTMSEVPATTPISDALSKDLKKRGFKFVGSTIMYAFMQAVGMVNDHLLTCPKYDQTAH